MVSLKKMLVAGFATVVMPFAGLGCGPDSVENHFYGNSGSNASAGYVVNSGSGNLHVCEEMGSAFEDLCCPLPGFNCDYGNNGGESTREEWTEECLEEIYDTPKGTQVTLSNYHKFPEDKARHQDMENFLGCVESICGGQHQSAEDLMSSCKNDYW